MHLNLPKIQANYNGYIDFDTMDASTVMCNTEGEARYKFSIPDAGELVAIIAELEDDMTVIDQLNLNYKQPITNTMSNNRSCQRCCIAMYSFNHELMGFMGVTREVVIDSHLTSKLEPSYTFRLDDIYLKKDFRGECLSVLFVEIAKDLARMDVESISEFFVADSSAQLLIAFGADCVSPAGRDVAVEMMYTIDTTFTSYQRDMVRENRPYIYLGMENRIDQ